MYDPSATTTAGFTRTPGFLLILCLATACGDPPAPEAALRDWLVRAEAAAEAKDRRALLDMIAPSYADGRGHDRDAVDRLLRVYFLRQRDIVLVTSIEEIELFADTAARVDLQVTMAGTDNSRFGFSADRLRFELELEFRDDEWHLIGARWGESGEALR